MNPKEESLLKRFQLSQRTRSFSAYRKIMSVLLSDYQNYESIRNLSSLFREKKYRAFFELADSLSSQKYDDATQHFVANQFALLIKKYPWPKDLLDLKPREAAVKSFYTSEKRCRRINKKFRILANDPSRDVFRKERGRAKGFIRSCIGSTPDYRGIFRGCDFGPGASIGVHGNATSFARKFSSRQWSVTPGALHHGYAGIRRNYHLWESLLPKGSSGLVSYDEQSSFELYVSRLHVVTNNKICFVPKTAKTERTIAVEPLLNGFVQKGIDSEMRKHLLKVGIDLTSQELNQEMARLGSLDDSDDGFVTIDLKSASDSISTELVRYLLPPDWFNLLNRTRSHAYDLDGDVKSFEKFCSMGNGFCFPLETLIFSAACSSVGAGNPGTDFSVYGDDLIVRKRFARPLIALLGHWGFKINTEKTFLEGPFRESCGKDWFGGQDVRPYTLDFALDSLQALYKFLNLSRRSTRCESFFASSRNLVINMVPVQFQFFRPLPGNDDTGIDSTGDEHLYTPSCKYRFQNGASRWEWRELAHDSYVDFDTLSKVRDEPWLISVALRGSPSIGFGLYGSFPKVTLRNITKTKVVRKGYASTSNWLPGPPRVFVRAGISS